MGQAEEEEVGRPWMDVEASKRVIGEKDKERSYIYKYFLRTPSWRIGGGDGREGEKGGKRK